MGIGTHLFRKSESSGPAQGTASAPASWRPRSGYVRGWRLAVLGGALAALAFALMTVPASGDRVGARAQKGATQLSKLPLAAQALVSRVVGRDEGAYRATVSALGPSVENPRHGFEARFSGRGVQVRSGAARLGLRLRAYGYGQALRPVAPAAPRPQANRVVYQRGALVEWYANGPLGLEQGFTLKAPPARRAGGPLTLLLALSGNLSASLAPAGDGLIFASKAGPSSLRYRGLAAFDAGGRELRAWLELSGGRRVLLRIDDAGARYPLTIDPFLQQAELTASDGAASDLLGFSVAISGDTVVAGAVIADGVHINQGAAYVFVKPGSGWASGTETAKLTASDGASSPGRSSPMSAATSTKAPPTSSSSRAAPQPRGGTRAQPG